MQSKIIFNVFFFFHMFTDNDRVFVSRSSNHSVYVLK